MNLLPRLPENDPIYRPVATGFAALLDPETISAANGVDGMADDFLTAAGATATEQLPADSFWNEVDFLDPASSQSILDAVNATGGVLTRFQADGDALFQGTQALAAPPDPGASRPPDNTPPPPLPTGGGGGQTSAGAGHSPVDCQYEVCNGCYEGDEPGCFVA